MAPPSLTGTSIDRPHQPRPGDERERRRSSPADDAARSTGPEGSLHVQSEFTLGARTGDPYRQFRAAAGPPEEWLRDRRGDRFPAGGGLGERGVEPQMAAKIQHLALDVVRCPSAARRRRGRRTRVKETRLCPLEARIVPITARPCRDGLARRCSRYRADSMSRVAAAHSRFVPRRAGARVPNGKRQSGGAAAPWRDRLSRSVADDDAEQRVVDLQPTVVFDESEPPKLVHEEVHA